MQPPLYIHPMLPPRAVRDASFNGFDDWTNLILSTGGWGWHADAGLATLRLILAGTFDRHPELQVPREGPAGRKGRRHRLIQAPA